MNQITENLLRDGIQKKQEGNLEDAIASFESALKLEPKNCLIYQQLGDIFFLQHKLDRASFYYSQALEIDCNIALIQYNLAEIYRQKGEIEQAVKHYTKAIELEPFNNSPFIQLMFMGVKPELLEGVVQCYQKLSQNKPNNPWVDVKLGNVLTKQGKIEKAIGAYRNASYKITEKFKPNYVSEYWKQGKPSNPTFIIIGPMKTATSAVYEYLNQHPLVLPSIEKEVHFFNDHQKLSNGKEWYLAHFPLIPPHQKFITGEASPGYIVNNVAERIYNMFPQVKIITLIRNPVDRAFSHYQHNVKHGFERRNFQEAINSELKALQSVENPAEAAKKWNWGLNPGYLLVGFYYYFLQQWQAVFPEEQILIISNQELLDNPALTMKKVFDFLSLPPYLQSEYPKHNAGSYQTIDKDNKKILTEIFQPHNKKLEEYLNLKLDWD